VKALTAKQHELGLYGAVGEIGVHHGKFLIPIIGNALAGEPAVALDLFEDQSGNVDTSGASAKNWQQQQQQGRPQRQSAQLCKPAAA
jgi:hypothetical protein